MRFSDDPFKIAGLNEDRRSGFVDDFQQTSSEVSDSFLVGRSRSMWLGKIVRTDKFRLGFFILTLLFTCLFGRLIYLQFNKGSEFRSLAEGNRLRLEQIPSARGIIFDRYHQPLVNNIANFSLFFQTSPPDEEKNKIEEVFRLVGLAEDEIREIFEQESYLPITIKENLSYEEALALMLKVEGISSLEVRVDPRRNYLTDLGLSHLLGYTSRITAEEKDEYLDKGYLLTERVGRIGLEEKYQDLLRGEFGKKQIEVDALGREVKVIAEEPAASGHNLILGLDAGLQQAAYDSLSQHLKSKSGAVIALDPRNGKVRAYISWPGYDNNGFGQGIGQEQYSQLVNDSLKPLFDRVIKGNYPSGSTIKPLIGLAALEEDLITRNTSVNSVGGVWYDKWFFPDWKTGGHGYTNIIKALAESVNTFFYYLALEDFEDRHGLGLDRMISYFQKFGLGSQTGIDLKGESLGFLPSPEWKAETKDEVWYPGDTLHLSIGQGDILVTPLQVANFTSVIANGGTLYKPQLLEKITTPQAGEITVEPEVLGRRLAGRDNIQIIRDGMRSAVTIGSARGLGALEAAGKTGTAQVGGDQTPHAWFTGFYPYQNPELVLTVLVENGGEGSEAAVPIARDILNWYALSRQ